MEARVIGMMSGSSLDGLDIADCTFNSTEDTFRYSVNSAITLNYPEEIQKSLFHCSKMSSGEINSLNKKYSIWITDQLNIFIQNKSEIDLIGLHGHTVFHEPDKGYSLQLGDGKIINSTLGIPIVTDFRNADIEAGGQGAPLSPKGDLDLYPDYNGFLNLGGISNFSIKTNGPSIHGFDICPFNLALNELASEKGLKYDNKGEISSKGKLINELFHQLNSISFYKIKGPRSIDRVWYEKHFRPVFKSFLNTEKLEDVMHTLVQHQSLQIAEILNHYLTPGNKILLSGGGAYNVFFVNTLREKLKSKLIIPDPEIVDYKEAIIFAYLALLRAMGKPNCIGTVTGAKTNSIGGKLFGNWNINTN